MHSTVTVVHQGRHRGQRSVGARLLQRIEHQIRTKRLRNPPTHAAPREDVDTEDHAHETVPRRHGGHVGQPQLVGTGGREIAFDQVL